MSKYTVITQSVITTSPKTCDALIRELNIESDLKFAKQMGKSDEEEVFHIIPEQFKDQVNSDVIMVDNAIAVGTIRLLRLGTTKTRMRIAVTTEPGADIFGMLAGSSVEWQPDPDLVAKASDVVRNKFRELGLWSRELPDAADEESSDRE